MVSLEQVRILEARINKVVDLINILKEENRTLKKTLAKSQQKISDMESLISNFKNGQDQIEQGIISVIKKLDTLEDDIAEPSGETNPAAGTEQPPQEEPSQEEPKRPPVSSQDEEPRPEEKQNKDEDQLDIF